VLVLAKRSAISQYFGEETARDLIALGIAPPHSVIGAEGVSLIPARRQEPPDARISRLISEGDPTVKRLVSAHEQHESAVDEVQQALVTLGCETELVTASRLAVFRVIVERMTKESRPPTLVDTTLRTRPRKSTIALPTIRAPSPWRSLNGRLRLLSSTPPSASSILHTSRSSL
jgi:hypothetical protein